MSGQNDEKIGKTVQFYFVYMKSSSNNLLDFGEEKTSQKNLHEWFGFVFGFETGKFT